MEAPVLLLSPFFSQRREDLERLMVSAGMSFETRFTKFFKIHSHGLKATQKASHVSSVLIVLLGPLSRFHG